MLVTLRAAAVAAAFAAVAACSPSDDTAAQPSPVITTPPSPSATPSLTPSPAPARSPEDPLSPKPAVESPAPVGQPTCQAATLTVADADAVYTDDAVQEVFVIRTSGAPCQLEGWPAVRLLDAAGNPLAVRVGKGGYGLSDKPPAPVTLTQDTSASFFVATARKTGCTAAATLEVTLPGTTTALRAATSFEVCDGAVGISPVQRLTDEEG